MNEKKTTAYIADFETLTGVEALKAGRTYVWAWAIAEVGGFEVKTGSTIEDFMTKVNRAGTCDIYFHNLKFDGRFILDYLFRKGARPVEKVDRFAHRGDFSTVISEMGQFYQITLRTSTGVVHFLDSLKKLPFSVKAIGESFNTVAKKGKIEYTDFRPEGYKMTTEERGYIENDVLVVGEALDFLRNQGLDGLTIGADCLREWKKEKPNWRELFPELSPEEEAFCRRSYRGGWCYCAHPGKTVNNVNGHVYDANSMYPSVMHSHPVKRFAYPCGAPIYFDGEYNPATYPVGRYPLYIQRFRACFRLKEGYLPTVQARNLFGWKPNDFLTTSENPATGEDEPLEFVMTSVDLDLFKAHYNILYIGYIDGYAFDSVEGCFDEYIDYWYRIKKEAPKGSALRALAKLMLNNLYGKFAQNPRIFSKTPYYEDGIVKFENADEPRERTPLYIPVGSFITAYARREIINAAQANYDIFEYADTDSIHILGEPKGIDIDQSALACFKEESHFQAGKWIRQKTYLEQDEDGWRVTACGMDAESKKALAHALDVGSINIDMVGIGFAVCGHRLMPKTIPGGVALVPGDFVFRP